MVLDDSSEEEAVDPDLEIIAEIKRKSKAKQAAKDDEIEFFDMANVIPTADGQLSEESEAARARIHRNLAKLEETKALLRAQMLEPPDCGVSREMTKMQRPIQRHLSSTLQKNCTRLSE